MNASELLHSVKFCVHLTLKYLSALALIAQMNNFPSIDFVC